MPEINPLELLDRRVAAAFFGNFPQLRPAQAAAIEPVLNGQNVVLSAGTGSGKTEAVIAPLLNRYWQEAAQTGALVLIYIAPTKALVNDLEKRLYLPLQTLGLKVGIRHGDRDDLALKNHPQVLITTPESLDVLLFRKDPALKTVRAVVIDEVHLLYNTQRGLQLSCLLQRLRPLLPQPLQWAALSATLGRLEDVRDFLFGPTEAAVFLTYSAHRDIDTKIYSIVDEASFVQLIHKLIDGRNAKLLVFANSRKECERLAGLLYQEEVLRPLVLTHYSSLSPEVRVENEATFGRFKTAICLATSTLELGIDIGDIDAVLLWDTPGSVESFLQRIGRSNRRSKKTNLICLVPDTSGNPVAEALHFLALLDAARNGEIPLRQPYELYGAVGQQCLNYIASDQGRFTRVAELTELFKPQAYLERNIIEEILAELAQEDYLQSHGFKHQYGADEKLHLLKDYRMLYGNFAVGSKTIEVQSGAKVLGTVPFSNLFMVRQGSRVRFNGKVWRVVKITEETIKLELDNTGGAALDFTYRKAGPRCTPFVANRIWQLVFSPDLPLDLLARSLRASVSNLLSRLNQNCQPDQLPYIRTEEGFCYLTFAGKLTNRALGLITRQFNYSAADFTLTVPERIDWKTVPTDPMGYEAIFDQLFEANSEQSLYQELLPPRLQVLEFLQDWLKDKTIPVILNRLAKARPVVFDPDLFYGLLPVRRQIS